MYVHYFAIKNGFPWYQEEVNLFSHTKKNETFSLVKNYFYFSHFFLTKKVAAHKCPYKTLISLIASGSVSYLTFPRDITAIDLT